MAGSSVIFEGGLQSLPGEEYAALDGAEWNPGALGDLGVFESGEVQGEWYAEARLFHLRFPD